MGRDRREQGGVSGTYFSFSPPHPERSQKWGWWEGAVGEGQKFASAVSGFLARNSVSLDIPAFVSHAETQGSHLAQM